MDHKGENIPEPAAKKFRFGLLQVMGIVALAMIVTALLTAWWVKHYIYASKFTSTVLTVKDQKVLHSKLAKLEGSTKKTPVVSTPILPFPHHKGEGDEMRNNQVDAQNHC